MTDVFGLTYDGALDWKTIPEQKDKVKELIHGIIGDLEPLVPDSTDTDFSET